MWLSLGRIIEFFSTVATSEYLSHPPTQMKLSSMIGLSFRKQLLLDTAWLAWRVDSSFANAAFCVALRITFLAWSISSGVRGKSHMCQTLHLLFWLVSLKDFATVN